MQYRRLGSAGLKVSELGLGTWMFGARGNPDHDQCCRIIHRALDAGINLVDTADVYQGGESEEIVGKALRGRRHEAVLATKVLGEVGSGPNDRGLSQKHIMQVVDSGRDPVDRPFPRPCRVYLRAAALQLFRSASRERHLPCLPAVRAGGDLLEPAELRLVVRQVPSRPPDRPRLTRRHRPDGHPPSRFTRRSAKAGFGRAANPDGRGSGRDAVSICHCVDPRQRYRHGAYPWPSHSGAAGRQSASAGYNYPAGASGPHRRARPAWHAGREHDGLMIQTKESREALTA